MAISTSKRLLLLVAFLLLCFISLTAQGGRTLRERSVNNGAEHEKGYKSNTLKTRSKAGEKAENNNNNGDDFVTMDYTPAKKKPPIHN